MINLVWWKPFDWFITALIILNSVVFLGMMDYTDKDNVTIRN